MRKPYRTSPPSTAIRVSAWIVIWLLLAVVISALVAIIVGIWSLIT